MSMSETLQAGSENSIMRHPRLRVHASRVIVALLFCVALSACEKKPSGTSQSVAPATGSPSAAAMKVDWSKIQPVGAGDSIMSYKTLARHCDAWYKGGNTLITLRYDGAAATDGSGHSMKMSPESWKGVAQAVRQSASPTIASASKSALYGGSSPQADTFGTLPRYKYEIEVVDDSTIRLKNIGKFDDGV